ncbi:MAG TPA: hypothetical protein VFW34_03965 [Candidatus Rubrimentiphilum sp.]|nr:hypothetical protein [Candidatus Rubrimentiphilum sp.]
METTYYTCLNQHCAKHRNVFLDGDSEHERCERTVLRFDEESKRPGWLRWAVPAAAVVAALVAVQVVRRSA